MEVLQAYLTVRAKSGMSVDPEAPLFCHAHGGYSRVRVGQLLRAVIRLAGLKVNPGRGGPRFHDLRQHADSRIMPTPITQLFQSPLLARNSTLHLELNSA